MRILNWRAKIKIFWWFMWPPFISLAHHAEAALISGRVPNIDASTSHIFSRSLCVDVGLLRFSITAGFKNIFGYKSETWTERGSFPLEKKVMTFFLIIRNCTIKDQNITPYPSILRQSAACFSIYVVNERTVGTHLFASLSGFDGFFYPAIQHLRSTVADAGLFFIFLGSKPVLTRSM